MRSRRLVDWEFRSARRRVTEYPGKVGQADDQRKVKINRESWEISSCDEFQIILILIPEKGCKDRPEGTSQSERHTPALYPASILSKLPNHATDIKSFVRFPLHKQFIQSFHQAILNNDTPSILSMYESGWNRITQQYYSNEEWPEGEVVAGLVGGGQSLLAFQSLTPIKREEVLIRYDMM